MGLPNVGATLHIPANTSHLSTVAAEASLNRRRHNAKIVLVNSPVEPDDLNVFFTASLDNLESGLNCCDAFFVVAAGWMNEVVLHIDDKKDGLLRVLRRSC